MCAIVLLQFLCAHLFRSFITQGSVNRRERAMQSPYNNCLKERMFTFTKYENIKQRETFSHDNFRVLSSVHLNLKHTNLRNSKWLWIVDNRCDSSFLQYLKIILNTTQRSKQLILHRKRILQA